MGKVRMVVALVGLVAGCGRTVTGPPMECETVIFVTAAGDSMPPVTLCYH